VRNDVARLRLQRVDIDRKRRFDPTMRAARQRIVGSIYDARDLDSIGGAYDRRRRVSVRVVGFHSQTRRTGARLAVRFDDVLVNVDYRFHDLAP